jgi:hypothetical protein
VGAIYLAHAPAAEQRQDIIRTKPAPESQCHDPIDYTGKL